MATVRSRWSLGSTRASCGCDLEVRRWGQTWTDTVVDTGKESHLGARLVDLNGDGTLDIVSIAYDAFQNLHIWRNDARR
ncbi:MAG: hypothetical protein IPI20_19235 [Rhodoferax sp.]|nr:hypothetical protein [Rhodoferax sp.]